MADESLVSLLREGVEIWNEWRLRNERVLPDLTEADLSGLHLFRAFLGGASLSGANLSKADLSVASLVGANLSGADLSWANLSRADLSEAKLSGCNLMATTLRGAFFSRTNFERATAANTVFADIDFSSCMGLESIQHAGPSTLGVDSIILSKGRILKSFLRGVGLPDEWIDYIPSLVGDAIQFFRALSVTAARTKLSLLAYMRPYNPREFAAGWMRNNCYLVTTFQENWREASVCGINSSFARQRTR